ncbi:MAG: helix-turn-helix domain-containing protein [Lactobacillus sp.]|nr:helix-turn-helix domain-containing protein [Lactobacillus sp.]
MENRLKEIRQKNNLTLKELGSKIGIPNNSLSQYENGRRQAKLEVWQKLADFFDVSVPYIQGFDEHRPNRIKKLRQLKKVSQGNLAKVTGLTNQAISQYENGKRNPNEKVWQQLADYFDVSVPYLKGEIDTEYLEKLVELLILLSFPKIDISYGDTDIDDDTKPFISVEIMSQICKSLGYDSKNKFLEIYKKVVKLVDDTTTVDYLQDFKNVVIQLLPMAKGITKSLLNAYDNL